MAHENVQQVFITVWKLRRTTKRSMTEIGALQHERLVTLVRFAREHSRLYSRLYSHLPAGIDELSQLPIVPQPELMEHFDEWATDPQVTRASVEEFIADPARIGHRYLDRYAVQTTSGITGRHGIFVHDDGAHVVYTAMLIARTSGHMRSLLGGGRVSVLVVPGGHFAVTSLIEALRRRYHIVANAIHPFSVISPLPELGRELNALRPTSLIGYPTLIQLLAKARATGRLTIEPELVTTEYEWLSPVARAQSDRVDVLPYST